MQYADKLQQEITRLARLSGLDLRAVGAEYQLEKSKFYCLLILVRGDNQLEIHYHDDPRCGTIMQFFTLEHRWAPLRLHLPYRSPLVGAELNDDETGFVVSDIKCYGETVRLCNLMAKEIHSRHFEDEDVKLTIGMPKKISTK